MCIGLLLLIAFLLRKDFLIPHPFDYSITPSSALPSTSPHAFPILCSLLQSYKKVTPGHWCRFLKYFSLGEVKGKVSLPSFLYLADFLFKKRDRERERERSCLNRKGGGCCSEVVLKTVLLKQVSCKLCAPYRKCVDVVQVRCWYWMETISISGFAAQELCKLSHSQQLI